MDIPKTVYFQNGHFDRDGNTLVLELTENGAKHNYRFNTIIFLSN